ncbi:MAG: serine/threonine-protein kinase, partial [Planctomycetota bacterium]
MPDPSDPPSPRDLRTEAEPTVIASQSAQPGDGEARATPASSPSQPSPEGRPFGRYTLVEELGHGGMGVVWKAWDSQLSRVVALKMIRADSDWGGEGVERFAREARLAARLRHPNIVPVHDVGVEDGQHFFTADFIDGRTLDAILESPVPLRELISWVRQVAEALGYAHANGVVHRDIKPSNILVDGRGQPYVMDFGLAREVAVDSGMTVSGQFMGTP